MKPDAYDIKSKIGVVFQDVAVFEELTVYDNIDYFCGLYIKDKKTRKQYIEEAIELVGLSEFKKFYPKQLSGGLLRRLNIACGIAHKPQLIFLDEPTVAVDPQSRNNILDGIKKLRDNGATIVYTTHYMEEVEILCDRIIILDKGKILATGTSDELKELAKIEEKVTIEVNNLEEKQKIEKFIKSNPECKDIKVKILKKEDILDTYEIRKQISKMKNRKVWLKCGGFITIDKTEALTAIDVNTGKYTGTNNNLQETILKVNKEATYEIAKQLRLRDVGGIIIIDYIDMADEKNKEILINLMKEELKKDRTKTQVEGFTKLDLMELTRKHICSHKE